MTVTGLRVVTVCTANICRSPFAQVLLQGRLGRAASVTSGGIRAMAGSPMDSRSRDALAERGLTGAVVDDFRATALTPRHVEAADLVLTATVAHRDQAIRLAPRTLKRTFTLLEFSELAELVDATSATDLVSAASRARVQVTGDLDIADPVGLDTAGYRAVMTTIDDAVARITGRLGSLLARRAAALPAPEERGSQ